MDAGEGMDDVWPAVNLKDADYKGRGLKNIGAARWDWYDFRQEVATRRMDDAIKWIRSAGEKRPLIHEYNIITPGGLPEFLRWSRVAARPGKDGIHQASGTFDREFDYHSLLYNLAICKGASDPPWQSNEQKGNTPPEWMSKHAWILIAMRGTGMHFWDWRSDDWGVVKRDGSESDGYPSAVRMNARFRFLGDLLAGSRPMPTRIGLLLLSQESFFAPYFHDRERQAVVKALLEHGSGMEVSVITDDEVLGTDLRGCRLIICPGQARMRESVRERLADFVHRGGTLWLTSGSASKDETDTDTPTDPAAPLDRAAGVKVGGDIDSVIGRLTDSTPVESSSAPFGIPEISYLTNIGYT